MGVISLSVSECQMDAMPNICCKKVFLIDICTNKTLTVSVSAMHIENRAAVAILYHLRMCPFKHEQTKDIQAIFAGEACEEKQNPHRPLKQTGMR